MKLSFSLSSKPSKKPPLPPSTSSSQPFTGDDSGSNTNPTEKQYVTEFDPTKAPVSSTKPAPIIPPKPNEWRPTKRMKNIDLPDSTPAAGDQPLQFEVDNGGSVDPSSDSISYGLNLRQSENPNPNPKLNSGQMIDPTLRQFREDMKRLPDHNGLDEYTDMPVEGFGAALLKGYGWVEGRGIGRNAKEDIKVVEYKRWTAKEGIGFTPEMPEKLSSNKEGGKVERSDGDGGKKDREKGGLYVGKEVRVVRGKEMGMKGRILEVKSGDWVILKVGKREDDVRVQARDVAELGSVEEERCLKKLKELEIREEKGNNDCGVRKKASGGGRSREETMPERKKESRRSRGERNDEAVAWLASHIRVRIISRDLKGGRLYLKKGEVVDVVGPTICDVRMDETGELIQGVDQDMLDTALPKRGGPVLVLYGRYKGVYGHLVKRDSEKGTVEDGDTKELLDVRLEQIAEYMGDPSYIGY